MALWALCIADPDPAFYFYVDFKESTETMSELCDFTATQLRQMIGRKDISPVELVDACIERVEMVDPQLNAMDRTGRNGRSTVKCYGDEKL